MTRHKYSAKPTVVDGHRFPSGHEAKRYGELKLLECAGQIRGLELQPKFPIVINGEPLKMKSNGYPNGRAVKAKMDFAYFEGECRIIEDAKGMDTPVSRLKRALVEHIYNVEIRLV